MRKYSANGQSVRKGSSHGNSHKHDPAPTAQKCPAKHNRDQRPVPLDDLFESSRSNIKSNVYPLLKEVICDYEALEKEVSQTQARQIETFEDAQERMKARVLRQFEKQHEAQMNSTKSAQGEIQMTIQKMKLGLDELKRKTIRVYQTEASGENLPHLENYLRNERDIFSTLIPQQKRNLQQIRSELNKTSVMPTFGTTFYKNLQEPIKELLTQACLKDLEQVNKKIMPTKFHVPSQFEYEVEQVKPLNTGPQHQNTVTKIVHLEGSRSNAQLATVDESGLILLWNTTNGNCVNEINVNRGVVQDIKFVDSQNSFIGREQLIFTSTANQISIWDLINNKELFKLQQPCSGKITLINHGQLFTTIKPPNRIQVWQSPLKSPDRGLTMRVPINNFKFGQYQTQIKALQVQVIHTPMQFSLYNLRTSQCLKQVRGPKSEILQDNFSKSNRTWMTCTSGGIEMWNLLKGERVKQMDMSIGPIASVSDLRDGAFWLQITQTNDIGMINLFEQKQSTIKKLGGKKGHRSICYLNDGANFAISTQDFKIKIFAFKQ